MDRNLNFSCLSTFCPRKQTAVESGLSPSERMHAIDRDLILSPKFEFNSTYPLIPLLIRELIPIMCQGCGLGLKVLGLGFKVNFNGLNILVINWVFKSKYLTF